MVVFCICIGFSWEINVFYAPIYCFSLQIGDILFGFIFGLMVCFIRIFFSHIWADQGTTSDPRTIQMLCSRKEYAPKRTVVVVLKDSFDSHNKRKTANKRSESYELWVSNPRTNTIFNKMSIFLPILIIFRALWKVLGVIGEQILEDFEATYIWPFYNKKNRQK